MVAALEQLDGPAVRRWARAGVSALLAARSEIDELNVFPVPDADTGTNLVRTWSGAAEALADERGQDLAAVCESLAGAALRAACGNSGTIVAQLLRGLAEAAHDRGTLGPADLAGALATASALARTALVHPVEGTIISVADAVAGGALEAARQGADLVAVTRAAAEAGAVAVAATPGQLSALGGRVDAGGFGLQVLVEALAAVVAGADASDDPQLSAAASRPQDWGTGAGGAHHRPAPDSSSPSHEVMYLLETDDDDAQADRVAALRTALDRLGDSVLVVGGRGLWQVHAHVDDVGAAVEVGFAAGRPHQVRIVAFADGPDQRAASRTGVLTEGLTVVASADGPGLMTVLEAAGARVLAEPFDRSRLAETLAAVPGPVVLLPGSADALQRADELAGGRPGLRVVRSRSAVQVIAALAVHDATREPEADLLAMATAAAGCRAGLVERAEGDGVTSAGVCRRGDILGHVDGDVALIGRDVDEVAVGVLERLLGGGGELVTLVIGQPAPPGLAARLTSTLRGRRPDVDVTTYDGGQPSSYLLVGVE